MSGIRAIEVMVFGANGFVGSLMFTTQRITIGRDPAAMVRLDDPSVSLKHVVLVFDTEAIRLKDLGSRTGTRVNGAPASSDPLEATDEIGVGTYKLRLSIHRADAEQFAARRRGGDELSNLVMPTPMAEFEPRAPAAPAAPVARRPRIVSVAPGRPAEGRSSARPAALVRLGPKIVPREVAPEPVKAREPDPIDELLGSTMDEGRAAEEPSHDDDEETAEHPEPPRARAEPEEAASPRDVLPVVMSRPRDADDDDDDDSDFEPPFDLLDTLTRAGLASTIEPCTVEVVQFRDDRVISVRHIAAGESFLLPGSDVECGARAADGTFVLNRAACGAIHVRQNGRPLTPAEASGLAKDPTLRVVAGTQVFFDIGEAGEKVLVHLVPRANPVALPKMTLKPSAERLRPTAFSVGVHIAIFAIVTVAFLGGKKEDIADVNAGRFATIVVKDIELEPPPPKPPEPEPPPPEDAPTMPAQTRRTTHAHNEAPAPRQTVQQRESAASTAKILSALGGSSAPSVLNVTTLTNLDAIPQGTGGFKVSGVVGKTPGDTLRIASSSDSQIDTKSANELGSVGKIQAHSSSGVVRARVTGAPPAMQGEGHLARGDIQRVINAHIYQVQGCYERQLMKDPSLAGKVSFQWVISPSGAVNGVRVGQSSLHSGEVTNCIQTAIQGWIFPQPQGGSVTVTYPFSFIGS